MNFKQRLVFATTATILAIALLIARPATPIWFAALCMSASVLSTAGGKNRPPSPLALTFGLAAAVVFFGLLAYADWLGDQVMPSSTVRLIHPPVWASAAVIGGWFLFLRWRLRVLERRAGEPV